MKLKNYLKKINCKEKFIIKLVKDNVYTTLYTFNVKYIDKEYIKRYNDCKIIKKVLPHNNHCCYDLLLLIK